jgi:hypothetical protein
MDWSLIVNIYGIVKEIKLPGRGRKDENNKYINCDQVDITNWGI